MPVPNTTYTPYISTPFTSSLRRALDLPAWEWLRFAPFATAAGYCTCTSEVGADRFIYFMTSQTAPNTFWRYDTWTDGWQNLASPNAYLLTYGDMRYVAANGYRCRVLSGSTTNMLMPALTGQVLSGSVIKIQEGTGRGQFNTILSVSDPIIYDQGVVTTATIQTITDTTKRWKYNQWAGYQIRLVFDAGASQIRKILYNDNQNIYVADTNYQQIDPWADTAFSNQSPFTAPVNTAGSQTYYVIEASTVTMATPWTVAPDLTSKVIVYSGGIWFFSSAAATPYYTLQYYDVAADTWYYRTTTQNILGAAATDCSMEKFVETAGMFDSGSMISPSASLFYYSAPSASVCDTTKSWSVDRYVDYQCRIVSGSGNGQRRRIIAMTGSSLQVVPNWDVPIDSSSVYAIYGDTDKLFATFGGQTTLLQYNIESDLWSLGDQSYTGLARNMSAKWWGSASYEPMALASITKYSGSIWSMSVLVGGSGYVVGDQLLVGGGSTNNPTGGKVRVTQVGYSGSTNTSGSVLAIEVFAGGNGYISGSAVSSSNLGATTGTGFTGSIFVTGSIGRCTTPINHWFQRGDAVYMQGITDTAWVGTSSFVLGVDSLTGFDVTGSVLVNPTSSFAIAASSIVDSNMSWSVNELVGKIIFKQTVGISGSIEAKRITANTATTASVVSAWAAVPLNGVSRYVIFESRGFGRDEQFRNPSFNGRGYAASASVTNSTGSVLYDYSKTWNFNQWSGSYVRFVAGTGNNNECLIYTNNSQSINFFSASVPFSGSSIVPDTSSKYIILDSFGISTGTDAGTTLGDGMKNWTVNQWAGKRCRFLSGTGLGQEFSITSNTSNVLTFGSITGPSTDTNYVIYGAPARGSGIETNWVFGTTVPNLAGKYIWSPVGGGSNRIDRYDITQQLWDYGIYMQPISETLNTGTMYCYDGINRIYFTTNATGRVMYLDLTSNRVIPLGMTPYAQGAAVVGNKMETFTTPDGLQFLVIFRHTGQEVWRCLISA